MNKLEMITVLEDHGHCFGFVPRIIGLRGGMLYVQVPQLLNEKSVMKSFLYLKTLAQS